MSRLYRASLRYPYVYLPLTVLLGVSILVVSSLPHALIERSPYPTIHELVDMGSHFVSFVVFDFLLLSSVLALSGRNSAERTAAARSSSAGMSPSALTFFLILGVLWGALCESVQLLGETRSFQGMDVAANTVPAIGWYLAARFGRSLFQGRRFG